MKEFWLKPILIGFMIASGYNLTNFLLDKIYNQSQILHNSSTLITEQNFKESMPFSFTNIENKKLNEKPLKNFKLSNKSKIFFENYTNDLLFFSLPKTN